MQRLIVALTGSTGAIYGVRLLEVLREQPVEVHLVLSKWGERTVEHETTYSVSQLKGLAAVVHGEKNQAATISSGSFQTMGMVIAPCSMKTLAGIAHGYGDNLIGRAADVVLKERRKLVLVPRETPLNDIHLENMLKLSRMGVVIMPPMPAFYHQPQSIDDLVNQTVMRILDQFGLDSGAVQRWAGQMRSRSPADA